MWTCPKCGTKVDPSFDVCWSCGTTPSGVEDPSFVRAEEAGPIDDPPVEPNTGLDDLSGSAQSLNEEELVECYWARNVLEAKFLADQLIEQGIPAPADELNLRYFLSGLPLGPYFGPRIWVRASDHDRAHAWLEEYDQQFKSEHGGVGPGLGDSTGAARAARSRSRHCPLPGRRRESARPT